MTGYTRQSAADIIPGRIVAANPLNNEFNALQSAFSNVSGHAHDGSSGNAPKISLTTSITGVLPVINGGTGESTLEDFKTSVGLVPATTSVQGIVEKATTTEVFSCTVDKFLDAGNIKDVSAWQTVSYASSITPNWNSFLNAKITITDDLAFATPTNSQDGTFRRILVKGIDSNEHSLSFSSKYIGPLPTNTKVSSTRWIDIGLTAEGDNFLVTYVVRELE